MNTMNLTIGLVLVAAAAAPPEAIARQQTATPTTASAEVTPCAQAQKVVDQLVAGAMARLEASRQANTAADMRAAVDSLQNTMRDVRAQLAACASVATARETPIDHSKMPMGTTPEAKPAPSAKPVVPAPMDHSKMPIAAPASTKPGPGEKPAAPPAMDHSKMPMGNAPAAKPATGAKPAASAAMDHSKMPMGNVPAAKPSPSAKPGPTEPMDHSKMAMGATPDTASQATDPVCGLKVDPVTAPHASHEGKPYSFCSEQHRQLFQKTPTKYLPKGK